MTNTPGPEDTQRIDPVPDGPAPTPAAAPADRTDGASTARPRRRRAGIGAAVGLLALAGAYVGVAAWSGGRVPDGTSVAGIEIGGQDATQAAAALEAGAPDALARPVEVTVAGEPGAVRPVDAGMALDVPATVDRLTGFTLDPRVLYARLAGGGEAAPVLAVDEAAAAGAMRTVASAVDREPVDGALTLTEGRIEESAPAEGIALDVEGAADVFTAAWPTTGPVELPADTPAPAIDAEDVEAARTGIAEPLVSAPVVVAAGQERAELDPAALTEAMSIAPTEDGQALRLVTDQDALHQAVVARNEALGNTGRDATIVIEGGAPVVVPAEQGMGMDRAQLAGAVEQAALSTEDRTAEVELTVTEPDVTTEQAEALGVKEPVVEFSTRITRDAVRTRNLVVGSEKITNTLVKPGETFSLLSELGPITRANGFAASGVIESGFTSEAVGGGLSQLSTNTFNAGWLAGMVDVEHQPHSRWYARYPTGREATLWEGQIDMIWKNDTPYGVLVEAWVAGGEQHVRLWSTKYWDVEVSNSGRYNVVQPSTRVNHSPNCVPEGPGPAGFTIENYRVRSHDGVAQPRETLVWTYNPWHAVTCG